MKKGDLVRYYKNVLIHDGNQDFETHLTYEKAIVVKDYEKSHKLVKITLMDGTTMKVHASQVQLHKRTKTVDKLPE